MEKTITSELIEALKNDAELYHTWQSNIAVAFQLEWEKIMPLGAKVKQGSDLVHDLSNNAAKNFLNQLINKR